MMAWMVVFWGVLIALIVWGIRKLTDRGDSIRKQDPLNVVKERYARGEITKEEFEQQKKDLS
jgi:putative membrane protein